MDIVEFYKQLSNIIEYHKYYGITKSNLRLKNLLKEAKDSNLDVNIYENVISNIESFYEESSYEDDSYEDSSSYDD